MADGLTAEGLEAQRLTITAFVIPGRRERWLAAIDRPPPKRAKNIRLYDTRHFDARYLHPVQKPEHKPELVSLLLRRLGSPEQVWVMHEGMTEPMPLEESTESLSGIWGLLIAIPGRLAYLETEVDGGFLLRRESN